VRTKEQKASYDQDYIRKQCVKKTLLLNKERDADIIAFLEGKNVNACVKNLIRAEISRKS
jgi:hypothetical protein